MREKNGRTKPWHVKFWGIGNEAWGCGANMTAEHYADVYRQYATFMTNWNNSDRIVSHRIGPSDDDYPLDRSIDARYPHNMLDALALHHYSVINWNKKSSATNFSEDEYFYDSAASITDGRNGSTRTLRSWII
jgi:alpha-N-arabinofuranosidase